MSKVVVTGGAGFIGSSLVRALLRSGAGRVTVLDNLSSGKQSNLAEVSDRVELCVADICDYGAIAPILAGAERVFHLAAIPSVPKSIADPVPSHDSNIEVLPKVETMKPDPLSPYALQKLVGEYYCSVFTKCFGLETVGLRFFNVYGPRQDPSSPYSGVLSVFMTCLLERRAPTIFGDGEQSRDFTYVEDVAGLCLKAAAAPAGVVSGNVYNAGNGDRFTLNQVWRQLCAIEGVSIEPLYGPARAGDVKHSQADTTIARRDLGHNPQFSFDEGLRRTLEWYRHSLVQT